MAVSQTAKPTFGRTATPEAEMRLREELDAMRQGFQRMTQALVGGGFSLAIGIILLGFLFDLDLVTNFSGPFAGTLDTIQTVLGAALTIGGLAMLAFAGRIAYSMFSG